MKAIPGTFTRQVRIVLGITGIVLTVAAGRSEEPAGLLGAQAAIDRLATAAQTEPQAPAKADARLQFSAELAGFVSNAPAMPPGQAAGEWLRLVDRFSTLPNPAMGASVDRYPFSMAWFGQAAKADLSVASVFAAVPGPETWPLLATKAAARATTDETRVREAGLRTFTLLLNQEWTGALGVVNETLREARKNSAMIYQRQRLEQVRRPLERLANAEKSLGVAADFERVLDALRTAPAEDVHIVIPELVGMVGTNEAARLLEKAVSTPNAQITVRAGPDTRRLLKVAVLRHLASMTRPQWLLVRGADAVEYYEAMCKRFPPKKSSEAGEDDPFGGDGLVRVRMSDRSNEHERRGAGLNYVLGLLAAQRQEDALRVVIEEEIDVTGLAGWRHDPDGIEVPPLDLLRFSQALLAKKPEAPVWDSLVIGGLAAGRESEVEAALVASRVPFTQPKQQAARNLAIARGWLALDRLDEALAILRTVLAMPAAKDAGSAASSMEDPRRQAMRKLVELGCVLDRADLVGEGTAPILAALRAQAAGDPQAEYLRDYEWNETLDQLIEAGRYRQAEELTLALLSSALRSSEPRRFAWSESSRGAALLGSLATVYHAAGRPADVLVLLERAPWWGMDDLARAGQNTGSGRRALLPVAAAALLAGGRTHDACRLARARLMAEPGDDDAYAVLARAGESGTLEWLDALSARNRFEERPLIWKAVLQLKAGKAAEAEETIRAALKIDPTDGETRAGDRARSYAVLADVLEARGKTADAALFRNVVASVRLAEEGDALTRAGLLRRSLACYDRASELFADAYCVQWRLAERLYATGHPEEAEKHYAIVFERMPEQFGRVASLCFGCEGVFGRAESRSVAERILTRLATNATPRPQVFFLIGELREAQGRYLEACDAFRKAVSLDPEYMDGWRRIEELAEQVALPPVERNAIHLKMLSLDPLGSIARRQLQHITDLKSLWDVVAANQNLAWEPPATLFPLVASKAALDQKRTAIRGAGMQEVESLGTVTREFSAPRMPRPGEAVLGCSIVSETMEALWALAQ